MLSFYLECSTGYFGMNCSKNCSGHCGNNESCDHVTGVCFNGCQDGYIGARCDESETYNTFTCFTYF